MLHTVLPLTNTTIAPDATVKEVPTLKTKTALGLPWASKVTVPVNEMELP